MKLFRKIYLLTVVCMLLLSMTLLSYLLWESRRQNLAEVTAYESERVMREQIRLEEQLQKWQDAMKNAPVSKAVTQFLFRDVFDNQGCLFYEGQELFNNTPYSFSQRELQQLFEEQKKNNRFAERPSGVLREIAGRSLLINYVELRDAFGLAGKKDFSAVLYRDVTDIYTRTRTLFWRGLLFVAAALLVTAALLYGGIYRALSPLLLLKQAAASIAGGNYSSRVPVRGRDEIAELTVNFNQMAEQVETQVEELTVVNERQRQLLGSLAHELKTPLTAVIGYADTLLNVKLSEENRGKALRYIRSEGQRLSRLSEKLLELTGLYENGAEALSIQWVSVSELLEKLRDLTGFRLGERRLHLELLCEPEELQKRLDSDLTMSLLMNLMDNACKASQPEGRIRVEANERELSVTDWGKGIPREELERVTEAFYMVDKARAKSAGSVGLGLALCRQIAELHGWRLQIDSEEGQGTAVRILWAEETTAE